MSEETWHDERQISFLEGGEQPQPSVPDPDAMLNVHLATAFGSESGRIALHYLVDFCGLLKSSFVVSEEPPEGTTDPILIARHEGRRDVVLDIVRRCGQVDSSVVTAAFFHQEQA